MQERARIYIHTTYTQHEQDSSDLTALAQVMCATFTDTRYCPVYSRHRPSNPQPKRPAWPQTQSLLPPYTPRQPQPSQPLLPPYPRQPQPLYPIGEISSSRYITKTSILLYQMSCVKFFQTFSILASFPGCSHRF